MRFSLRESLADLDVRVCIIKRIPGARPVTTGRSTAMTQRTPGKIKLIKSNDTNRALF